MSFELRHARRMRVLKTLIVLFQAVAVAYLAMHAVVTWLAYQQSGALNAVLTFLTLGFGDLYWAIRLVREAGMTGGMTGEAMVACAAAAVCFTSWVTRPLFDGWVSRFTQGMLADTTKEIGKLVDDAADAGSFADGVRDDDPPPSLR